jgi:hypothetical protein
VDDAETVHDEHEQGIAAVQNLIQVPVSSSKSHASSAAAVAVPAWWIYETGRLEVSTKTEMAATVG